jgi:hypothetical protein
LKLIAILEGCQRLRDGGEDTTDIEVPRLQVLY